MREEPRGHGEDEPADLYDDFAVRIRAGDVRAFADAYQAYHPSLIIFAESFVFVRAVAEELVQDVFSGLWEHRATLMVTEGLEPYLYTLVKHRALNWLRHERVVSSTAAAQLGGVDTPIGMSQPFDAADATIDVADTRRRVARAVARLPARQRQVVALRWVQGKTYEEISGTLGISVKAVRWDLQRAYTTLRGVLRGLVR